MGGENQCARRGKWRVRSSWRIRPFIPPPLGCRYPSPLAGEGDASRAKRRVRGSPLIRLDASASRHLLRRGEKGTGSKAQSIVHVLTPPWRGGERDKDRDW